jgi:hypothetical protein
MKWKPVKSSERTAQTKYPNWEVSTVEHMSVRGKILIQPVGLPNEARWIMDDQVIGESDGNKKHK